MPLPPASPTRAAPSLCARCPPALPPAAAGADAFFPVFLYVVMRSCLPRLASNVEYVKRFRTASRLTGQFDFMLCNLVRPAGRGIWCMGGRMGGRGRR